MREYTVTVRLRDEDPEAEEFLATYLIQATDVDSASKIARETFIKENPEFLPTQIDTDIAWGA